MKTKVTTVDQSTKKTSKKKRFQLEFWPTKIWDWRLYSRLMIWNINEYHHDITGVQQPNWVYRVSSWLISHRKTWGKPLPIQWTQPKTRICIKYDWIRIL
jgi:hypothetical protein